MSKPTASDWAYLGGLIDGEGCINLRRQHGGLRGTAQLTIAQTYAPVLLYWVEDTFGGLVAEGTSRGKRRWVWYITGRRAVEFLEQLKPHLRLKQEQAQFVIDHHGDASPGIKEKMSKMKREVVW